MVGIRSFIWFVGITSVDGAVAVLSRVPTLLAEAVALTVGLLVTPRHVLLVRGETAFLQVAIRYIRKGILVDWLTVTER